MQSNVCIFLIADVAALDLAKEIAQEQGQIYILPKTIKI